MMKFLWWLIGGMTEAKWLAETNPAPLLERLGEGASKRKLRLFACACCRRHWHMLGDEASRAAIEFTERTVDVRVSKEERDDVRWSPVRDVRIWSEGDYAHQALAFIFNESAWWAAFNASAIISLELDSVSSDKEDVIQCTLLRDIFGNPFRPASVSSAVLTWNDGTVVKLARAIYEERAFNRLPILADALEEAGCEDADILNHCRSSGEHVRGCWVIDLILGKV